MWVGIKEVTLLRENENFFGIVRQMTRYVRDGSNQGETDANSYKHVYNPPNDTAVLLQITLMGATINVSHLQCQQCSGYEKERNRQKDLPNKRL